MLRSSLKSSVGLRNDAIGVMSAHGHPAITAQGWLPFQEAWIPRPPFGGGWQLGHVWTLAGSRHGFFREPDPAGSGGAVPGVPFQSIRQSQGRFELDTREGIWKGGEGGPAVVPGDLSRSRLITAISHEDPDLTMPPKKPRLSDAILEDFRTWIKAGAPDPRETSPGSTTVKPPVSLEAGREFWAFRKPLRPDLPQAGNSPWAVSEIDRLVIAGWEASGLAPSPDATPPVLLRRLHFDLVGLPPTPVDIVNFTQDVSQRGWEPAMERVVDTLLASERFGECWGRHWLDVARFAESSGRESNLTFPHAWRYRDYVIAAFNADLPFDRFLTEQIAGGFAAGGKCGRAGATPDRHRIPRDGDERAQ